MLLTTYQHPTTRLSLIATSPKTQGLDHCVDLIDPHTITLNVAKVLSHNRATMLAGGEVVDMEAVMVGILPTGAIMKTIGLTITQGAAITLMARVTNLAMGETQETNLNRCHALSRTIPAT